MASMACVQVQLLVLLGTIVHSLCLLNEPKNLCCQLELKKIIDKGAERFIPSDALSFGKTVLGFDIYFFFSEKGGGYINSTARGQPYVHRIGNYTTWKDGVVLTNPNNCVLQWQSNDNNVPIATVGRHFVFDGTFYSAHAKFEDPEKVFGSSLYGLYDINYRIFYAVNIDLPRSYFGKFDKPLQFLYVDCFATLKSQVVAELYDIISDIKPWVGKSEKILASAEVINESEMEQPFKIDLDAKVFPSLEMSHETTLPKFVDVKWGLNATPSASFALIEDLLDLSPSHSAEKESSKIKDEFVKSGMLSFRSEKLMFEFHQQVRVKAKVLIKSKPIAGHGQFTAHYRIKPKVSHEMWTNQRIRDTFERLGFDDLDQLQNSSDGLILAVEGQMSIQTATDTHASIISQPLDLSKTNKVVRTTLSST